MPREAQLQEAALLEAGRAGYWARGQAAPITLGSRGSKAIGEEVEAQALQMDAGCSVELARPFSKLSCLRSRFRRSSGPRQLRQQERRLLCAGGTQATSGGLP